ncbi:MAG: MBL fold metallo-hydrolase [Candidatus Moraniibacteriota bacterium]
MNITKFGHCCLLIETKGVRLLTDPGRYNDTPLVGDVDAILISHEHRDHLHIESLRVILGKNPAAQVISHTSVGKMLDEAGIPYTSIADGGTIDIKGVSVESCGSEHACIHQDLPKVQNTGFFIDHALFYPGDSFHDPKKDITVLALPVAGPWMRLEEAIEYAKQLKPKVVFPVHDGMLRQGIELEPTRRIPTLLLEPLGIAYVDMIEGSSRDFSDVLGSQAAQ